jgi:transcription elongation factor GreA
MSDRTAMTPPFQQAIEAEDWDLVEELWFEALDTEKIPIDELLEVRRNLWKAGNKTLALTLLELLADAFDARDDSRGAVRALSELVRLSSPPSPEMLLRLEERFAAARRDCPSLRPVLDRYRLSESRKPVETLAIMERWLDHDRGSVVEVIGKGVGRVTDANLELETIKVDLGGTRPVSVPFGVAGRYLRRLPEGDFRRRKVEDVDALVDFVRDTPGEALVELLSSHGDPVDVSTIKSSLGELVPADSWISWWNKARAHPRVLASGSGSRLRYSIAHSAESASEALLSELLEAPPRDRLTVARRLGSRDAEAAAAATTVLADSLPSIETADPGLAWETAGVLADLPNGAQPATACRRRLINSAERLRLLSGIHDRAAREAALEAIRSAHPDEWADVWAEWFLHEQHPIILGSIARRLEAEGEMEIFDASVEAVFRNHTAHPAQFMWACEAMTEPDAPEQIRRRMTPSLLEKLPDALGRGEFGPVRARAKDLLAGGRVAVRLILEQASPQQSERFISRVGRLAAVEPQRLRVLEEAARHAQGAEREDNTPVFVATRFSVEAKRQDLKRLLEVDIPKTLKGIQAAAAEGDLRENFEYHMLRDRQELQSARAAALQRDLGRVQILQPGSADTSKVNIGTIVRLTDGDGQQLEPITILGSWDADPSRRVFANNSGIAQLLLGNTVGDSVEVEGVQATIAQIDAWSGET